eukprot:c51277_g1_i1 orf=119-355(+)
MFISVNYATKLTLTLFLDKTISMEISTSQQLDNTLEPNDTIHLLMLYELDANGNLVEEWANDKCGTCWDGLSRQHESS